MTLPSIQPFHSAIPFDQRVPAIPAAARTESALTRVLHVINGEHYSGAERVQDLLAARLPECGFEVGFVCVKPGRFPRSRQYRAARLLEAPMRSKFDWRVVRQVVRLVRDEQYVAVHAHTPRSALIARAAAAITGIPLIYHVHSPTSRDTTHRLRNFVNHWMERISLLRVDALVAVSSSLQQYMVSRGYPADRVFTVPNGVPVSTVQRDSVPPQGTWTLGMAALFRPRKGLEVLLDAMSILHREGLPIRLHAVGPFETQEYEQAIQHHVNRLGIGQLAHWTGFATDVMAELTKMDLFLLPSLFGEGLPMVVLEAMAAGVPVVASRVEGVPEAIEHGVNGLLVNPQDPVSLADCIRSAVRGDANWTALRQCALQRHAAEFSDRRMATRLAEIYRRLGLRPDPGFVQKI